MGHKKIKISDAWDEGKGAGITVAVIDTGIDYNHIDLCNSTDCNINKVNSGYGVNFLVEEGSSERNEVMDKNGHGTHIAGIISAIENSKGVVGLAPKAKILALKAIADDGTGDIADIAEAITYAADNEADVIICSLEAWPRQLTQHSKQRLNMHMIKRCVIVVPAGNDDEDSGYSTLAQYPEAIVVSASH